MTSDFKSDRQRRGFFARLGGGVSSVKMKITMARERHRQTQEKEREEEIEKLQVRLKQEKETLRGKTELFKLKDEERKTKAQLRSFTIRGKISKFVTSPETKRRLKRIGKSLR